MMPYIFLFLIMVLAVLADLRFPYKYSGPRQLPYFGIVYCKSGFYEKIGLGEYVIRKEGYESDRDFYDALFKHNSPPYKFKSYSAGADPYDMDVKPDHIIFHKNKDGTVSPLRVQKSTYNDWVIEYDKIQKANADHIYLLKNKWAEGSNSPYGNDFDKLNKKKALFDEACLNGEWVVFYPVDIMFDYLREYIYEFIDWRIRNVNRTKIPALSPLGIIGYHKSGRAMYGSRSIKEETYEIEEFISFNAYMRFRYLNNVMGKFKVK